MGKDWRAPGETWVRVGHTFGWELVKLRPVQLNSVNGIHFSVSNNESSHATSIPIDIKSPITDISDIRNLRMLQSRNNSSSSLTSIDGRYEPFEDEDNQLGSSFESSTSNEINIKGSNQTREFDDNGEDDIEKYIPHCKVKTAGRSKEFIGCTSMSEALMRLDLARGVVDVRRFNYICKVVQILVNDKLQNISASARKHLFAIIQAIVLHCINKDMYISTARDLLNQFGSGLEGGHVCGSPQLVCRQQDTVSALLETTRNFSALPDSSEESITFLDLPREVISQILSRLPDHLSMLEASKAHETLKSLIETEKRQWLTLTKFHFSQFQIEKHRTSEMSGRHLFFELKKYYGLREVYADLIHICCHCKNLFWRDLGHPCVSTDAPSVRVMPQQFVDMLTCL